MPEAFISELEDIIWDECGQTDGHLVPHPNEHGLQGDDHKKGQCEVTGVSSSAAHQYAAKCVIQKNEERDFPIPKRTRNTMLEKDKWSHIHDSVFSATCDGDSRKKRRNIDSIHSELCAYDSILREQCTEIESNSYNFSPSRISQADNNLSFFDNDTDDKESSDCLYYGLPDIRNFEDVDRMLRSCDSSLGLGGSGNDNELGWFPSPEAIEGSEDALKSDFKFSCYESNAFKNTSEYHAPSMRNSEHSSINDSRMGSALASYKSSSWPSGIDEPDTHCQLSFVNGSNQISKSKGDFVPKETDDFNHRSQVTMSTINCSENDNRMINLHKKQPKHQNQTEGKLKDKCSKDVDSYHHTGNLQNKDVHLPSGDTSRQVFTFSGIRLEKQYLRSDSSGYLQTSFSYNHSNHYIPSAQAAVSSTLSGTESENNGLKSVSPKDSSYASNQIQQPIEGSHDQLFEEAASICDPVSVQKNIFPFGNEFQIQSDVEGVSIGIRAELGSSNVKESPSMNSGQTEISLEATSFRQLQQVVEQLDSRTKQRIRDSLLRLARTAEQRHNSTNMNGGSRNDRDRVLITEETKKATGIMEMETDTNPVDRSVAHLLFHRPSDSSAMPAQNASSHTYLAS